MNLTGTVLGLTSLAIFVIAYALVMAEERFQLRKSIPTMIAAGVMWMLAAAAYAAAGNVTRAEALVRDNVLEFGELFLFLLAAVTYVNTMEERQVFDVLRARLVARNLSMRTLFWVTGLLAFGLSPVLDNLTTTLVMGAVVMAIAGDDPRFVTVACINIVVAANAGGAFSPFGDITTLMVWQSGILSFGQFFRLFLPAAVNWLVPAAIMSFSIRAGQPASNTHEVTIRPGGRIVIALFAATIATTVLVHQFLHLPPVIGMMTGLGALHLYSHALHRRAARAEQKRRDLEGYHMLSGFASNNEAGDTFDVFGILARVEWDTLMFFYGVILCVGALAAFGYLGALSNELYSPTGLGPTAANTFVGVLSAVVDNIPIMFAVLSMNPAMSANQWLLVTLTAGVGGSLLSIGSAAGVALMGQARGSYTFGSHLRWTWAVALGYAAAIGTHLAVNGV